MSIEAAFLNTEDDLGDWRSADRVVLGVPSSVSEQPVASVGVRLESGSRKRIDLFASTGHPYFQDVRCVGQVVYVGYGQQVCVFAPEVGTLESYALDGYFGHLFTASDLESSDLGLSVLVASELLRFDDAGKLLWRCAELGVDGVIVHRVQDNKVFGDAEWDPPGGWEPFRLRLDIGDVIRD